MSRGPGRIERETAALLDAEPDNAFTVEDLCQRIYPGVNRVEKKHRVSVLRAMRAVAAKRLEAWLMWTDRVGRTLIIYRRDSLASHCMAQLKRRGNYRSNDPRQRWSYTEEDLRGQVNEKLARDSDYREDGLYWDSVDRWNRRRAAERNGDRDALAQMDIDDAEYRASLERLTNALAAGLGR